MAMSVTEVHVFSRFVAFSTTVVDIKLLRACAVWSRFSRFHASASNEFQFPKVLFLISLSSLRQQLSDCTYQ